MADMSPDDWKGVYDDVISYDSQMPDRVLGMLRQLGTTTVGFGIPQLDHLRQTATRAYRANASDELILCALTHDIGKVISNWNHPAIGAEMLWSYVSEDAYRIVGTHQDFQSQYYPKGNRDHLNQFKDQPWFQQALTFSEEWDQASFDPKYPSKPLAEFEPLIRTAFAKPLRRHY
jgi:predicted HD phosphohydrolase